MEASATSSSEPRWRRLPGERPSQITDAAFRVFGQHGLAGARLEDIAREAGVSKGTIYLYFDSKDALFRAVVHAKLISGIEEAEASVAGGNAADGLRALLRRQWAFMLSPTFQTMYALVNGELRRYPDLAEFYGREVIERAQRLIAGIIGRGIENGEFRHVDPMCAARIAGSLFSGQAVALARRDLFHTGPPGAPEALFDEVFAFYLGSLRSDKSVT